MARTSSRQRMSSRRAQRQRQKQTRLIVVVAVVALIAVGILVLLTIPRGATEAVAGNYEGMTQEVDRSEQGIGFAIGNPDAPVTLVEYSDFSCPHCHDLAAPIHQIIDEYVPAGDLRVVFKPIAFVNPPYSGPAAQAAICAGEQGKFWEMSDQIWALYDATGPGAYTPAQLSRQAEAVGLDMRAYQSCFNSAETQTAVQNVILEAQSRGIQGTPALFLNGEPLSYRGAETAYGDIKLAVENALGS